MIVGFDLAPANMHDLSMVEQLSQGTRGWMLGDCNYWSPLVHEQKLQQGLSMLTPKKKTRRSQKRRWPHHLVQMRGGSRQSSASSRSVFMRSRSGRATGGT